MKKITALVGGGLLAGSIALTGCGKKEEPQVSIIETSQKCEKILYGLAQNCTINAEVRGIKLTGSSDYSIAGMAGKESDTGSIKRSNVPTNVETAVRTIEENIKEQVDKSSYLRTDVKVSRQSITLKGNALGTASYVGNMESGKYSPGFGAIDSANSTRAIDENKINAKARCNDTIDSIGKNIATNVTNNVDCKGEVIPFTNEELNTLLSVGGWLLEYNQEYREKNISPAIIAFSYIKGLESGKIKNDITDPTFISNLEKAITIVKSKHFVNIDGVEANIGIKINKNEITKSGIWTMIGGIGLGGLSIAGLFGIIRRRNRNR